MKKSKLFIAMLLTAIMTISSFTAVPVLADDDVKPRKVKIVQSKKTVYRGTSFEVKARTTPRDADDDYLRWSIVGKKGIIKFDDDDRNDDEAEFKALKVGTTKVRCRIAGTKRYSDITITVKKPVYKFSRIGRASRRVEAGDDFELKVKKSGGTKDNHLKWYIKNTRIVRFDDDDRTDDEIELEARRPGKTTVTCKNLKTKKTITYTITVVPDRDYDDDDDDDDDDNDDDDDDDDDD